ncbi:MAG: TetR/AcrR family transcriptional regulator [Acidimicrobiia bacterium]
MDSGGRTRRSPRSDGERSRAAILSAAADLASLEGLAGLTIGRLADRLEMSKSGVFAHFGSKEDLQLATIEAAQQTYAAEIVQPALAVPPGLGRVRALVEAFLSYSERRVFPGGCFFGTTIVEQASRPGRVRDRLARAYDDWVGVVALTLRQAQGAGELGADADTEQLAFEIASLLTAGDWARVLHDDPAPLHRARRAVHQRLVSAG